MAFLELMQPHVKKEAGSMEGLTKVVRDAMPSLKESGILGVAVATFISKDGADVEADSECIIFQDWRDMAAIQAFTTSPTLDEYRGAAMPYMAGPPLALSVYAASAGLDKGSTVVGNTGIVSILTFTPKDQSEEGVLKVHDAVAASDPGNVLSGSSIAIPGLTEKMEVVGVAWYKDLEAYEKQQGKGCAPCVAWLDGLRESAEVSEVVARYEMMP